MHELRPYLAERDLMSVTRIWREVGWVSSTEDEAALVDFLEGSNVEVALIDGAAECSVTWVPGSILYQDADLPMTAINAVTTSRIARKTGLATVMTARAVRAGAETGAAVAALGMFDQGFYERVGFGTNIYHHDVSFDPTSLKVSHVEYRSPVRLTIDDHLEMHELMARRTRRHGGVVIGSPVVLRAEIALLEKPFGLGYRNSDGRLTHFVFGETNGAHGPYRVRMIAYEEPSQLLELLRLFAELADQVTSVSLPEPPEIQLWDLIATPLAQNRRTRSSAHAAGIDSFAWMQLRIVDLEAVIGARSWSGPTLRCNLSLTDPITKILARTAPSDPGSEAGEGSDTGSGWSGIGGDYVLTIGETSGVEPGTATSLPTLTASVGAFSRCWFGVRPATSLALTDAIHGPDQVLVALDDALRLPTPHPGWDF